MTQTNEKETDFKFIDEDRMYKAFETERIQAEIAYQLKRIADKLRRHK